MTNNQAEYHKLCDQEGENIPFFSQAWWLDAVCGDQWDVVFHHNKNGEIQGAFPFEYRYRLGIKFINTPRRSPFTALWLRPKKSEKLHSKVSHYRSVCTSVISKLPKHHFIQFKLAPEMEDWYPFYLHKFGQKLKYTYWLDISVEKDLIYHNFHKRIRREIKPFLGQLKIKDAIDLNMIYLMQKKSFEGQNETLVLDKEMLHKIHSAASPRDKIIQLNFLKKDNTKIGSIYGIIENKIYYALFTGMDKKEAGRGMFSFIIWKLVEYLKERNIEKIDFCGSMMPEVERRLRHLNSQQVPYHIVWHGNCKLLNYFFWNRYIK